MNITYNCALPMTAWDVHQHDEWFLEFIFNDERFNDGMLINIQLPGGYSRAAMFLIGIQAVGERRPVRPQENRRLSRWAFGFIHR